VSYATFARKDSEASAEKTRLANGAVLSNLRVGDSNDAYEREADRVADAVLSDRRGPSWSLSKVSLGKVQRQTGPTGPGNQPAPQPNNHEEVAKKLGEAFLKTDVGKRLTDAALNDPLVKGAEDFIGTLPGKVIAGAAAVGAVTALAATHKELPAQIPEIPLDKIRPGLSVQITYEGPVDKPTKAMITFSYTPRGKEKKPKQTKSERYRTETARIAAEQEKFRAGMRYKPGPAEDLQQKAEQKMMENWMARRFGPFPGTPGGAPLVKTYPAPQGSPDTGLRMPAFQSPFRPKPFHVLDQQLELRPLTSSNAPAAEEKKKEEAASIQRKAAGGMTSTEAPATVHEVLRSSGTPLEGETRRLMESRIGFDFSKVRIHTDARASVSARAMNATAYTVGSDVVFASGEYSPRSSEGQKLLAHELAHTVQQHDLAVPWVGGLSISRDAAAEREANHAAEHAETGPRRQSLSSTPVHALQRKCACGGTPGPTGECEECGKKRLQRKEQKPETRIRSDSSVPAIVDEALRSPGQPLDISTLRFVEPRFGHDFSQVRVHTDLRAAQSARAVNALAYTVGRNVVFGPGAYQPKTNAGMRLLAHELTHVVQQSHTNRHRAAPQPEFGRVDCVYEQEAYDHAKTISKGVSDRPLSLSTLRQPRLQRFAPFDFIGDIFTKGPSEAFARLFGEGEFSEKELLSYLETLKKGKTEGRYDSDNKARAIVRLWKVGNRLIQLTPQLKKLLVREMWEGVTTSGDAEGILDILERSTNEDLSIILGPEGVLPQQLFDAFPKDYQKRLQRLFDQRLKGGSNAAMKGTVEPGGPIRVAPYLNDQSFRERWTKGLDEALSLLRKLTAARGCSFPRPGERRIDDKNWKPFQSNRDSLMSAEGFEPQRATPFEAVTLLFDNLNKWTCDCRLFPEIAMLYAWHEALKDSPEAFNNKFANLVLRPEQGTTGLERDVIETDDDLAWREAPLGTKVDWKNTSPAARIPWTDEHAIKSYKGKPGEEDRFAAHPLGFDLTETKIKDELARHASDYPWKYTITANALTELLGDGVDRQVVDELRSIQGVEIKGATAFLDLGPLVKLRKQAKQDPPRFSKIINKILAHARQQPDPKDAKTYVDANIVRFKIEIPK
jgi:hypothetical protein